MIHQDASIDGDLKRVRIDCKSEMKQGTKYVVIGDEPSYIVLKYDASGKAEMVGKVRIPSHSYEIRPEIHMN